MNADIIKTEIADYIATVTIDRTGQRDEQTDVRGDPGGV